MIDITPIIPRTQEQAVAMIKNPVGSKVPYDFKNVRHLIGFLLGESGHDNGLIITELTDIVNDVLGGIPIPTVSITSNMLRNLDAQVWEFAMGYDGHLTTQGVIDLATLLQGILRAKYVQLAGKTYYQYPIFVPVSSLPFVSIT